MLRFVRLNVTLIFASECKVVLLPIRTFTAKQQRSADGRLIEKSNKPYFHKQSEESVPHRIPGTTKVKYTNKSGRVFTFAVPTSTVTHPQVYHKSFSPEGWHEIDTSYCDLGDLEDDMPSEIDDAIKRIEDRSVSSSERNISCKTFGQESNHQYLQYCKNNIDENNDTDSNKKSSNTNRAESRQLDTKSHEKLKLHSSPPFDMAIQREDLLSLQRAFMSFCREYVMMDKSGFANTRQLRDRTAGPEYDMYDRALKRRRHWLAIRHRFEEMRHTLWPTPPENTLYYEQWYKCHLTVSEMLDALMWIEAASTFRVRSRREFDIAEANEFDALDLHREVFVLSQHMHIELELLRRKHTLQKCYTNTSQHPLLAIPDKYITCISLCQNHKVPISAFYDNVSDNMSITSCESYKMNTGKENSQYGTNITDTNNNNSNMTSKVETSQTRSCESENSNANHFSDSCMMLHIPQLHSLHESLRIIYLIENSKNVEPYVTFSDNCAGGAVINGEMMESLCKLCSHSIYGATDALNNIDQNQLSTLMTFAIHLKECNSEFFKKVMILTEDITTKQITATTVTTSNSSNNNVKHKILDENYNIDNNVCNTTLKATNDENAMATNVKFYAITLIQFMETVLAHCKLLLHQNKNNAACIINDDVDNVGSSNLCTDDDNDDYGDDDYIGFNEKERMPFYSSKADNIFCGTEKAEKLTTLKSASNERNNRVITEDDVKNIDDIKNNNNNNNNNNILLQDNANVALSSTVPLVSLQKFVERAQPQALVHYKVGLRFAPGLRHATLNARRAAEFAELVNRYETLSGALSGSSLLAQNIIQHISRRVSLGKNILSMAEIIRLLPLLANMMLTHNEPEAIYHRYEALFRACGTSIGVEMQIEQTAEDMTLLLESLAACHFVPSSFKQVESVTMRMMIANAFSLNQLYRILSSFVKLVGTKMMPVVLQQFAASHALKKLTEVDEQYNSHKITSDSIEHLNDALHILRVLQYCHYKLYPEVASQLKDSCLIKHCELINKRSLLAECTKRNVEKNDSDDSSSNKNNNNSKNENFTLQETEEKLLEHQEENHNIERHYERHSLEQSDFMETDNKPRTELIETECRRESLFPWWSYSIAGVLLAESAIELAEVSMTESKSFTHSSVDELTRKAKALITFSLKHVSKELLINSANNVEFNKEWLVSISDVLIDVITCCAALEIQEGEVLCKLMSNVSTLHSCCTPLMALAILESLRELNINEETLSSLYIKYIDAVIDKLSSNCTNCKFTANRLLSDDLQLVSRVVASRCVSIPSRNKAAAILQKEVNRLASLPKSTMAIKVNYEESNKHDSNGVNCMNNDKISFHCYHNENDDDHEIDDDDDAEELALTGEHLRLKNKEREINVQGKLMQYRNALAQYAQINSH